MKKILIVILCIFIISGCNKEEIKKEDDTINNTYKEITQQEAYGMMEDNVYIIDVREDDEYASGHIENAINIPVNSIQSDINNTITSLDTVILLYCKSGKRAQVAAKTLVDMGYKNVYTFGGIETWPYDIVY